MATSSSLSLTLLPEAAVQLHDALICLSKFNESVCIEADYDFLRLSTLNPTKTGYASFKLASTSFFAEYSFHPRRNESGSTARNASDKFCCQVYIKALLSVFKGRTNDFRGRDTAIERCVVQVFDGPDEAMCRLVIQMICKQGVVKTYKLTYEAVEVQHALFDKSKTQNQWSIESKFLREIIDHFGPTAEQLDLHSENTRALFTSFTQKVANGKEILKQPVHTSVAIDTRDFENFLVEEKLHVAISVKDFKAIVTHADTLRATVTARYTRPCRPLQLSYDHEGMTCEFTLMTRGEAGDGSATSSSGNVRELSARPSSRPPPPTSTASRTTSMAPPEMNPRLANPPPAQEISQPVVQESAHTLPEPLSASMDPLFVPADDDRQWDEAAFEEDSEDILGWDANTNQEALRASLGGTIQDIVPGREGDTREAEAAIPPTQRISQIRGLFD